MGSEIPEDIIMFFKEQLEDLCRDMIVKMLYSNVNLVGFQSAISDIAESEEDKDQMEIPVTILFGIGNESLLLQKVVRSYSDFYQKEQDERDSYLN